MSVESSGVQTYRHILSAVVQWLEIVLNLWKIRAWAHRCSHLHSRWLVHVPSLTQWASGLLPWLLVPPTAIIHTQLCFSLRCKNSQRWNTFPFLCLCCYEHNQNTMVRTVLTLAVSILYPKTGIVSPSYLKIMGLCSKALLRQKN